ncbi:MAG: hypothetical protein I3J03_03330 [Actinomyces succiniciruminis]|nr:hypothetical protein [Actinomyces succiniciruminis]
MWFDGGEKVYAGFVERVLLDCPGVAAVRVRRTQDKGVVAAVAPTPGVSLTIDMLRSWCRGRLRAVEVPSVLEFVDQNVEALTK